MRHLAVAIVGFFQPMAAIMVSPQRSGSATERPDLVQHHVRPHDKPHVKPKVKQQVKPRVPEVNQVPDPLPAQVLPQAAEPKPEIHATAGAPAPASKIPPQLVLTAGKGATFEDLPPKTRDNVRQTLSLDPELRLRFLNDSACGAFIQQNFPALLHAFVQETVGAFRGDICRAAVIAVEGGFYADLDVQLSAPISQLVDRSTTFMSAFDASCDLWNAVFAAEPSSDVMKSVIEAMVDWYRGPHLGSQLMGTRTFLTGLANVIERDCPLHHSTHSQIFNLYWRAKGKLQFNCGKHNQIRLYREKPLECLKANSTECPAGRSNGFFGLRFGIFEPGPERKLVGWSRFENCTHFGCSERRKPHSPVCKDGFGCNAKCP